MERLAREHEQQQRWSKAAERRLAAVGFDLKHRPPEWPRATWLLAKEIIADDSGIRTRKHLARAARRNPVLVGAIRAAALEPGADGRCRRDWTSERARAIAALALAGVNCSKATRRKGRWQRCLRGFTRGSMAALLEHPGSRRRRHVNTLAGIHRPGAELGSGQLGYIPALQAAGFWYRQQLPAMCVERFERFRNGAGDEYAANRYWIAIGHADNGHLADDVRARLLQLERQGEDVAAELLQLQPRQRCRPPAPLGASERAPPD